MTVVIGLLLSPEDLTGFHSGELPHGETDVLVHRVRMCTGITAACKMDFAAPVDALLLLPSAL